MAIPANSLTLPISYGPQQAHKQVQGEDGSNIARIISAQKSETSFAFLFV